MMPASLPVNSVLMNVEVKAPPKVLFWPELARRAALRSALWVLAACSVSAAAQTTAPPPTAERTVNQWLTRLHEASREKAYTGTLVVSAGSVMSASRIWHVCDGKQQMERIDTLTGAPRTTIRRNSEVITFAPEEKTAWVESRESLGLFPDLLRTPANQIPTFYGVSERGSERVAGYLSDVVNVVPKDAWRFGYRIWSEKGTGLVMKMQTLDGQGEVMEQLAFTELQMNAPVRMDKLARLMKDTRGYQVHRPVLKRTTLEEQGWRLKDTVPGFLLMSCHTRAMENERTPEPAALQCVYSDGLATVSLFVEPLDAARPVDELPIIIGATHSMSRAVNGARLTVMGEVPLATVKRFALAFTR